MMRFFQFVVIAATAVLSLSVVSAWEQVAEQSSTRAGLVIGNSIPVQGGDLNVCKQRKFEFTRPNAPYVSVHFKHFSVMPGDSVTIASVDGRETRNITAPPGVKTFSSDRVPGPTAVITFTPGGCGDKPGRGALPRDFGFNIDSLEYTYERTVQKEDVCGTGNQNEAAVCYKNVPGVDANVYKNSMPVARLIKSSSIGPQTACTGWLLGSAGHLMTNFHCIKDQSDASRTNFEFMVQSPACDKSCRQLGDCRQFGKIESFGAEFVYANEKYDFAIVKLRRKPCVLNAKYGFLSLRRAPPTPKEQIYVVQHPNGGAKMIAYTQDVDNEDDDPTTGTAGTMPAEIAAVNDENNLGDFWTSYFADTERGSSGAPVISRATHTVIAVHSNGACKNSGAPSHLVIQDIEANKIELPGDAFA